MSNVLVTPKKRKNEDDEPCTQQLDANDLVMDLTTEPPSERPVLLRGNQSYMTATEIDAACDSFRLRLQKRNAKVIAMKGEAEVLNNYTVSMERIAYLCEDLGIFFKKKDIDQIQVWINRDKSNLLIIKR